MGFCCPPLLQLQMEFRSSKRLCAKSAQASESGVECSNCENLIDDSTQASIQCDSCSHWLHRKCAGLSKVAFDALSASDPFVCPQCRLNKQADELSLLREQVTSLSRKLEEVCSAMVCLESKVCVGPGDKANDNPTYAAVARPSTQTKEVLQSGNTVSIMPISREERRFNIVVFGANEAAPGTPRAKRVQDDLEVISSAISEADDSIPSTSIRDHFRLGKFKGESKHPRPILVKLNRSSEVDSILSNCGSVKSPLSIKRDLSLSERRRESALLKERWSLIQSGIERKSIKLRGNNLLVKNKVHATYNGTELIFSDCGPSLDSGSVVTSFSQPMQTPHLEISPTPSMQTTHTPTSEPNTQSSSQST